MASDAPVLRIGFAAAVIHWRGPSPFFFVPVPDAPAQELRRASSIVSYGWGMIPVEARLGETLFTTALFPKDGTYLLPLKAAVRRRANVTAGDVVEAELTLWPPAR